MCLLLRALYDLKQSPREWYATLRDFLISKDFKHIESNHSLFFNEETRLIVSVYVNDIQIYDPRGSKHISDLKKELSKRFTMIDLDSYSYYLSMEIQRNRAKRSVRIIQSTYLKKVLARFNMTNSASVSTSIIINTQLKEKLVNQATSNVVRKYQSIIKSMIYVMIQTRSDICFVIIILSRYNQNSNFKHIAAVKRVLRYLKDTIDHDIIYEIVNDLERFIDANWASDSETRRSLEAYVFLLYKETVN